MTTHEEASLESQWRMNVAKSITDLQTGQLQLSVNIEKVTGSVNALEDRMKKQEGKPANYRDWVYVGFVAAGCFVQVLAALIAVAVPVAVALITHHP